ncbi:hypothetical protein FACS1894204_09230 [Synergistales bacterium]|nr:hypothetical protein FACS1894204_09230 [Synergistales bacterium]
MLIIAAASGVTMIVDRLTQERTAYFWQSGVIIFFVTALFAAIYLFIVRKFIVNPINIMAKAADSFVYKNLNSESTIEDSEILSMDITTGDELQDLSESLKSMVRKTDLYVAKILSAEYIKNELALQTKDLEHKTQLAVSANESKSKFLATMSHEIRTPMNAIIGISEIQLMRPDLPPDIADALAKIQTSGSGLLGIINDILDFSKIESGKLDLSPAEYELPSLINDAVQLNIVRIQSKPIEFQLEVDPELYANMFGDELRIKQILNNILSNAFKYTRAGAVTLSVSSKRDGDAIWLRLSVADTGQGMSEENVRALFEEYSRFNEAANRATEGTGLGMSITRRLAEMMDGKIDVTSELGKGSVFTVTIKQGYLNDVVIGAELAQKLRNFEFAADRQKKVANVVYTDMSFGRVLIVDDVETNLYVAEGLMSPYKLSIETAVSGFEAISKIEAGTVYDIIFMDHMMPEMDGIETVKRIRSMGYDRPIVALTANALAGNDKMFKENGFDGFISKPIDIRQLHAALNKFVRDRHKGEAVIIEQAPAARTNNAKNNAKLMDFFRRDALKAVVTLRETAQNGDLLLFATTAHAMKSACANIDEKELSELAAKLEFAAKGGDTDFIGANVDNFLAKLSVFVKPDSVGREEITEWIIEEDTDFLRAKLSALKAAARNFDSSDANAVLAELRGKRWNKETLKLLSAIEEKILFSDFDEAIELCEARLV